MTDAFPKPSCWLAHRVSYGETDAMGVVYYANYLHLFERGRSELIRELGFSYATVEERAASQHDWQAQIAAAQRQLRLELIRGHAMVSGGYRAGMDSLKAKGA